MTQGTGSLDLLEIKALELSRASGMSFAGAYAELKAVEEAFGAGTALEALTAKVKRLEELAQYMIDCINGEGMYATAEEYQVDLDEIKETK